MLRVIKDLIRQAFLYYPTQPHHHQPVSQKTGYSQIMGNNNHGEFQVGDEIPQDIQESSLHGYVQTAGRLIHEDQTGLGDEISCDLEALLHPPGEGGRGIVNTVDIDLHPLEPMPGLLTNLSIVAHSVRHEPFSNVSACRDMHSETVSGVLVNNAHLFSHDLSDLGDRRLVEIKQANEAPIPDGPFRGLQSTGDAIEER
jgi:hypothetical protein